MTTPEWRKKIEELPPDVYALVNNAKVNGAWIYFEKTHKFFTPEEFSEKWQSVVNYGGRRNNFHEFKIVNPMFAVRLCSKWLDIVNKRHQEVLKKLDDYSGEFKIKK